MKFTMLLFYATLRNSRRILTTIHDSYESHVNESYNKNRTLNSIEAYGFFINNGKEKTNSGYDMRNILFDNSNNNQIINICKNFEKKNLLDKLSNPNIMSIKKLQMIDDNSHLFDDVDMVPNILSGGLFDDFNFEI